MNPRIKLLFVVGTALTIGRALDLGLWTDLESGLCAVGPVWLRYAALAHHRSGRAVHGEKPQCKN